MFGIVFFWVGWLGFNGGFCYCVFFKVVFVIFNINLVGSVGGVVWFIMDFCFERKWSMVGYCIGVIVGLVVIILVVGYVGVLVCFLIFMFLM